MARIDSTGLTTQQPTGAQDAAVIPAGAALAAGITMAAREVGRRLGMRAASAAYQQEAGEAFADYVAERIDWGTALKTFQQGGNKALVACQAIEQRAQGRIAEAMTKNAVTVNGWAQAGGLIGAAACAFLGVCAARGALGADGSLAHGPLAPLLGVSAHVPPPAPNVPGQPANGWTKYPWFGL